MNLSEVELPSNRKFGFFLTAVFWIAAGYCFYIKSTYLLYTLGSIGGIFFGITIIKSDIFLPLNKLWMKGG